MRASSKRTIHKSQGGRKTASLVFASVIIIGLFLLIPSFQLSSGTLLSLRGEKTTSSPFKTTRSQSNRRETESESAAAIVIFEDEQEDEPDVQSESGKNCETKKVTTKELNRHGKVRWADICDEEESDNEE